MGKKYINVHINEEKSQELDEKVKGLTDQNEINKLIDEYYKQIHTFEECIV